MSLQLPLPGFEAAPAVERHRLFFAFFPDAGTAGRIARLAARLRAEHGLWGSPLLRERFHVTLYHVGDFRAAPYRRAALAGHVAEGIAAAPFEIVLDRAMSFEGGKRGRPLVLLGSSYGVEDLSRLQRTLAETMSAAYLPGVRPTPAYTPHLTLLYDHRGIDGQPVEPIRWAARECLLVYSLVGQTRYSILGRWRLGE